jgi:hypothetical protein
MATAGRGSWWVCPPAEQAASARSHSALDRPIDIALTADDAAPMSDPFDGAGEPYKGSTYRGWILVAIVIVVVVVLLWLAYGEALDLLPAGTPDR